MTTPKDPPNTPPENEVAEVTEAPKQELVKPKVLKPIRSTLKTVDIELGCGLVHENKVHRIITVQSATVGDRKAFGAKQNRSNGSKMITELLQSKSIDAPGASFNLSGRWFQHEMLGFDRDQLCYEIRKATVGEKPFDEEVNCAHCGIPNHALVKVAEIEETFRPMPDEVRLNIERGKCVHKVELPEYGFTGVFAYSDGRSQEQLAEKVSEDGNPFETELEVISDMCLDFNGDGPITVEELTELDIEFLNDLQAEIQTHDYGYDFSPPVYCWKCKKPTIVRVNVLDFLFEGTKALITSVKRPKTLKG